MNENLVDFVYLPQLKNQSRAEKMSFSSGEYKETKQKGDVCLWQSLLKKTVQRRRETRSDNPVSSSEAGKRPIVSLKQKTVLRVEGEGTRACPVLSLDG